ncbi:1,3-beta-glucan synthase component bgs4, partial [Mycena polygramma]
FGRKFVESYFNLKLAFSDPGLLGPPVWERAQVAFRLAIIYRIDLTLVFLDTFLSHLWWNTGDGGWYRAELYAGAEYFDAMGGYTSPCRRGYAKLLATTNMESKYKPKVRPRITDLINATIISMHREHLLSIDSGHAQKLLYQVV